MSCDRAEVLLVRPRLEDLADLRDRGLLAYHMNDFSRALRDLEEYLKVARLSDQDDDQKKETEQVWEHVKTLRRRVAQLN